MKDKILDAPQNGLSKKLFALRRLPRIADIERLRSKIRDKNKRKRFLRSTLDDIHR